MTVEPAAGRGGQAGPRGGAGGGRGEQGGVGTDPLLLRSVPPLGRTVELVPGPRVEFKLQTVLGQVQGLVQGPV